MTQYFIHPLAEQDLDNYATYIAQDKLEAGLRLYECAEKTYQSLADFPEIGKRYRSSDPSLKNIRFFPIKGFSKYLVFYLPIDKGIEIVRVIRQSRNITQIL